MLEQLVDLGQETKPAQYEGKQFSPLPPPPRLGCQDSQVKG